MIQAITPEDVASLLDAVDDPEGYRGGALPSLRRALDRAPQARQRVERLEEEPDDGPSLLALAKLMLSLDSPEAFPASWSTALWLVRQSSAGRKLLKPLEELAEATGQTLTPGSLGALLLAEYQFERLAKDRAWREPADLLDPLWTYGIDVRLLRKLALARAKAPRRAARTQATEVLRKLEACDGQGVLRESATEASSEEKGAQP